MTEISVLYQDDAVLVINKPSGLLVHRGWAKDKVTALSLAREQAGQWVYPVHRLDRSASGVLVFALSSELARQCQEALTGGHFVKSYFALVRGITPLEDLIDYPLAPAKDKPKKEAVTRYQRLATFERYSWLLVSPQTGRLHQIRRHLRHQSHPLIGDVRYGKAEHNRLFRERFGLHRLCLHACALEFPHPVTAAPLHIEAPLPQDLVGPLSAMQILPMDPPGERSGGGEPGQFTSPTP